MASAGHLDANWTVRCCCRSNQVRKDFSETGGWVSAVVTGADGRGTVKVTLPDSLTTWQIKARAVTKDTDVGEGEAKVETRKPLQADAVVPPFLIEGDRTELTARAHNLTGEALALQMKLAVSHGEKDTAPRRESRDVKLDAGQETEQAFELKAASSDDLKLDLMVEGNGNSDHVVRDLVVLPWGVEQRSGRAGQTTQGAAFKLSLPPGREYTALSMAIDLGPDPGRDLIQAALGMGYRPRYCIQLDSTNLSLASHGFAALEVLHYLERSGGANPADAARLRGLAASAVTRLVAAQSNDGSFPWVGSLNAKTRGAAPTSDLRTTSQVVMFLALAKQRGLAAAEDGLNKACEWLLRNTPRTNEERARAALALSLAGRGRFENLNALHRARASMDLESLARLTIAWQTESRGGLADEVLTVLRDKLQLPEQANAQQIEAIALATTAVLRDDPRAPLGARAVQWLEGQRRGVSFGTPESTAASLWALVTAGGSEVASRTEATITASVNGKQVGQVKAAGNQEVTHFAVPADALREKDNQVDIRVEGRGTIHYSAMLTGFARGFDKRDRRQDLVNIDRKYLPAFLRYDGKVVQPGFNVVQGQVPPVRDAYRHRERRRHGAGRDVVPRARRAVPLDPVALGGGGADPGRLHGAARLHPGQLRPPDRGARQADLLLPRGPLLRHHPLRAAGALRGQLPGAADAGVRRAAPRSAGLRSGGHADRAAGGQRGEGAAAHAGRAVQPGQAAVRRRRSWRRPASAWRSCCATGSSAR